MTKEESKAEANNQAEQIKAARKLLKPEKVTLHKIPRWLSKRLTAYKRNHHLQDSELHTVVYDICMKAGIDYGAWWLDHWGVVTGGRYKCCHEEKQSFISEPYDFGTSTALLLDAMCKALDLVWHVTPNSWWYPGYTIRITIHERTK